MLDSLHRPGYPRAAALCGLLTLCFAAPLQAAEIEEVVVTAEKRESTIQDTPIAVTAVTREDIEVRGLKDFSEVQFAVPALVFSEIADMAQITMRGVGVDISTMDAEPGVAVYNDGVYRGGLTSSSSLLFDLERIEVLRGPQGTLYGRNSTGGSLNAISRLPGEVPAFDAALLYGDYDRTRVELSGDAPVVPGRFALRGALAYDQHDGYADNAFTGREEDDAESTFAKVAAVISPGDSVDITLRGEYSDSQIGGPPFILSDDHPVLPLLLSTSNPGGILSIPGTLCGPLSCVEALGLNLSPPGVGSDDPRNLYSDGDTQFDRESYGLSATIDWTIGENLALKSITSYFDIDHEGDQSNNDGVDITYLTDTFQQENQEWSQEFTLTGTAGRLDWIGGVYYYQSDIDEAFQFTLPALQATFEALFGLFAGLGGPLPPGSLAGFGTRLDGSPSAIPFLDFQLIQDLESVAAYGQGTYNFTDRLRGTAGVRWTRDEKNVTQTVANNLGGDFCRDVELDDSWSEVTGKLGVDADVGENNLVYASISRGFKAGGFNGGQCSNPYDPETLWALEVGSKSQLLDNTLQINMTAFYYDYKDLQARLFINNASIVQNAADAEAYGFELEWMWLAGEQFRFDGSVSLLETEFKDFLATDPLNPQIGSDCDLTGLNCTQDLSGNDLLRAPPLKATVAAEYDIPLGAAGILTARGEYAYTDSMYHTVFNNDFAKQDAYSLWNARLIWTPAEGSLDGVSVMAFVENIGDEDFVMIHAPNATTGGTLTQYGPPRTWGVQLRYSM